MIVAFGVGETLKMIRRSKISVMAVVVAAGASALALAQTPSSRTAQQEQGSQLLPEAQPPFSPESDSAKAAPAKAAQGTDKFIADRRSSVAAENAPAGSDARGSECNIAVCARFYSSFDPSSCTYQPYNGGPRRLCER
jgi:hypothetical protein